VNRYQDSKQSHSQCVVCGDAKQNPLSLQCKFFADGDNQVVGYHKVSPQLQGYNSFLHGGVASALVDAAMTHYLLMQGIKALTAEMTIRFVAPIKVGDAIKIVGRLVSQRLGMYQLEAALYVNNKAFVTASAKFIQPKSGVIG
jgi:acyl-coenzyme A thioesterase PaaI-like protein|tara:strand:+ start:18507 stop:18935 length:429 start_codon:yes stop_codon:yes gene_type:complete